MNSPALGLRVAGTIFGLVCLAQLSRLLLRLDMQFGGHSVPFWFSGVVVLVTAALCFWLWKLSLPHKPGSTGGPAAA